MNLFKTFNILKFIRTTNSSSYHCIRMNSSTMNNHCTPVENNNGIFKINSELMTTVLSSELKQLAEIFQNHNFELRLAGGAVRDLVSGKIPHDIDFATDATPTEMKEMFNNLSVRMINTNGEAHGTITARMNDKENFEITTLRIDKVTDGRRAEVEFTKDWRTDSERRDLTINSMFLDLEGNIYDYFNGLEDLKNRRILFVNDPVKRIQEDYLRILRYFRFFGRFALSPDDHNPDVLNAIKLNSSGLSRVSGERIWTEVKMILQGRFASSLVRKMCETGCLEFIGLGHVSESHLKELDVVYERCKHLDPHPSTLIAALMVTIEDVEAALKRLKFSNDELHIVTFIVKYREELLCGRRPYSQFQDAFLMSSGDKRTHKAIAESLIYLGREEELEQFNSWNPPKFPVNGHAMKNFGLKGRVVGQALHKLKLKWKESGYTASEKELLTKENLEEFMSN